jgi:protein TonB
VADNLFSNTYVPVGDKRPYTVVVSIVAHALIIAAAIMVPVMASDLVMPAQFAMIRFYTAPPLPPSIPPPSSAARTPQPEVKPAVPVTAPAGITPEQPVAPSTDAIATVPMIETGIINGGKLDGLLSAPAAAPVASQAPLPVGGDIEPPTKLKDAAPAYPAIARAARVQGFVVIQATIGPTGKVTDTRVLRSIPLLDAAALDAVRQWEYTPTRLNGQPIAVVMTVTVMFRLQ